MKTIWNSKNGKTRIGIYDMRLSLYLLLATLLVCGTLGFTVLSHAQISADFSDGAVRVGATTTTCDSAAEGALRYNTDDTIMELCDGDEWAALGNGEVAEPCEPGSQLFTTVGTQSFTVPAGCTSLTVIAIGGGGGAKGTENKGTPMNCTSGDSCLTAGGGSGQVDYVVDEPVTPGTSYSVTVGIGGTGGPGLSTTNGSNGGTSSFGSLVSASGGTGGQWGRGGSGGSGAGGTSGRPLHGGTIGSSGSNGASGSGPNAGTGQGVGLISSLPTGALEAGNAGASHTFGPTGGAGGYGTVTVAGAGASGAGGGQGYGAGGGGSYNSAKGGDGAPGAVHVFWDGDDGGSGGGSGGGSVDCSSLGSNVAESAAVTLESGQNPTYGSSFANMVTGSGTHIAWGPGATTNTTLRIDLGSNQPICQLRLLSYYNAGFEGIKDFRLWGGTTTDFASATVLMDNTAHPDGVNTMENYTISNPGEYRYYWFRIQNWYPGNGNGDPHIYKVELIPAS